MLPVWEELQPSFSITNGRLKPFFMSVCRNFVQSQESLPPKPGRRGS